MAKMTDIPTPHDLRKGELQWTPIGGNFRDGAGANCHIYHYRENHGRYNEQNSFLIVDAGLHSLLMSAGVWVGRFSVCVIRLSTHVQR